MQLQVGSVPLADGRRLSFELSGPPTAPLVILSNSLMTSLRLWDPFVEVLLQNGYRVLCYDQPGHGSSSPPVQAEDTTFVTLSTDVKALLDFLQIDHVDGWVGISMGAATGAVFATQYPGLVRKLVLSDTITCSPVNAGIDSPFAARVQMARENNDAIHQLTEGTLARWFQEDWRHANPRETERLRGLMQMTTREGFIGCCHALQHSSFDLRPLLGKIGACVESVLLLVGELDADLPQSMAIMRDEIQRGSNKAVGWAVIPQAGHVPVVDGRQNFTQEVLAFLGSPSRESKA